MTDTSAPPRFVVRPRDPRKEDALVRAGMHPLLARLYAQRGCSTPPVTGIGKLLPPTDMLGLPDAAERLADAIEDGEKLLVVADYDCDGATACAVAVRGLRQLGAEVDYLVPNRFETGYGLSPQVVDLALPRRPDLIVTVDNGIASHEGVDYANAHGIEVIVTDHHAVGATLPDARAIVNPNQPGCGFASRALAGVGVMFYVLIALRAELRRRGRFTAETQPRLDRLLDLVAVGTVADLVRLDENNRLLVKLGLERLRSGQANPGISALARVAGRELRKLSTADIGFGIGPRINAAGRLADMSIGIECLLTDDPARAFDLAGELDRMNAERRLVQDAMLDRSADLPVAPDAPAIVLTDPSFHAGVTGLVATKLKDRHHRPAIVFAPSADGATLTGSGRSIAGLHLRDAIDLVTKRAPGLVERFGGHAMAAGLTIGAGALDTFREQFVQVVIEQLGSAPQERIVTVDGPLETAWMKAEIAQMLGAEIWGQAFDAPLFADEFEVIQQRIVGERHVKASLRLNGQRFDAIGFNRQKLPARGVFAYRVDANEFNGHINTQLVIEHVTEA
ncbi:single-stranded-DNA-specific exonuclease RecJ [Derxia gummosa]|uniref:Single-stranded-DNA-specific exonuclease RecJ n=1 Tax=Derxia gummosa DSM 723 TaxID=1121388 RepID=A0A8B6X8T8_9BURK|nr:single-stranded-DNA-specific exonuclease RecJ [Derxia gummosa]